MTHDRKKINLYGLNTNVNFMYINIFYKFTIMYFTNTEINNTDRLHRVDGQCFQKR